MSPRYQRIAIAEACGWVELTIGALWQFKDTDTYAHCNPATAHNCAQLPDYLRDINAMHEAEKVLDDRQRQCVSYAEQLKHVLIRANSRSLDPSQFGMIHATAAQRAEAFLRTIGKWEVGQ